MNNFNYDFIEHHNGYTVGRKFYRPTDVRLGRHVQHDSRSLAYLVKAKDVATLKSVRHTRYIPVLNQGNLGSCTGNAGTGNLGTGVFFMDEGKSVLSPSDAEADEKYAVGLYSDATKLDTYRGEYPPSDTGSDGLSIAKALQNRGLINGYTHATDLASFLTALSESPVIAGVEWLDGMFNPDADGRIKLEGAVAGGHEIVFDELDVENKRVWFTNSWGADWGVEGRAYLTWEDAETLLSRGGDVTKFTPVTVPAPTPTPTPPSPEPTPEPSPEVDVLHKIVHELRRAVKNLEELLQEL